LKFYEPIKLVPPGYSVLALFIGTSVEGHAVLTLFTRFYFSGNRVAWCLLPWLKTISCKL